MALCSPPCTVRSAWRSLSRFSLRNASRPLTGSLKIAVVTFLPCQLTSRGIPVFTETSFIIRLSFVLLVREGTFCTEQPKWAAFYSNEGAHPLLFRGSQRE